MAIRSTPGDTSQHFAQVLESPNNQPSGAWAQTTWYKMIADPNSARVLFLITNNSTDIIVAQLQSDGTTLDLYTTLDGVNRNVENQGILSISIGVWNFFGFTRSSNGQTIKLYHGRESVQASLISTLVDSSLALQGSTWRFIYGAGQASLNIESEFAHYKFYNSEMSLSAIEAERVSTSPSAGGHICYHSFATYDTDETQNPDSGSAPWNFAPSGGTSFATVTGPSPTGGGGGSSPLFPPFPRPLDSHAMLRMRNPKKEDWRKSRGGVWYVAETIKQAA